MCVPVSFVFKWLALCVPVGQVCVLDCVCSVVGCVWLYIPMYGCLSVIDGGSIVEMSRFPCCQTIVILNWLVVVKMSTCLYCARTTFCGK